MSVRLDDARHSARAALEYMDSDQPPDGALANRVCAGDIAAFECSTTATAGCQTVTTASAVIDSSATARRAIGMPQRTRKSPSGRASFGLASTPILTDGRPPPPGIDSLQPAFLSSWRACTAHGG